MDKVRLGLIGCGGIMSGFHAKHLVEFDDIEVVAVADPIEERRNAMAKLFGAKRILILNCARSIWACLSW